MEKKISQETEIRIKAIRILKALLGAYAVTGVLLLIVALLLYKLNLDEGKVSVGITLIYVAATFTGGFLIGKMNQTKKFLWGMTVGILYFGILLLISIGMYHSLRANGTNVMTTLFLCAGGGTLGGMLA